MLELSTSNYAIDSIDFKDLYKPTEYVQLNISLCKYAHMNVCNLVNATTPKNSFLVHICMYLCLFDSSEG